MFDSWLGYQAIPAKHNGPGNCFCQRKHNQKPSSLSVSSESWLYRVLRPVSADDLRSLHRPSTRRSGASSWPSRSWRPGSLKGRPLRRSLRARVAIHELRRQESPPLLPLGLVSVVEICFDASFVLERLTDHADGKIPPTTTTAAARRRSRRASLRPLLFVFPARRRRSPRTIASPPLLRRHHCHSCWHRLAPFPPPPPTQSEAAAPARFLALLLRVERSPSPPSRRFSGDSFFLPPTEAVVDVVAALVLTSAREMRRALYHGCFPQQDEDQSAKEGCFHGSPAQPHALMLVPQQCKTCERRCHF